MDEKIVKDSQCLAKDLVNDCISRQAAIDALGERPMLWVESDYELGARNQYDADVLALETVPSVQPEKHTDKRTETHASDLISRAAAIDALENIDCSDGIGISALKCDVVEDAINSINALPSAQPERNRGKWIYNSPVTMKCDQCGLVIKDWDWHRFKFCPNCDCDMRGEQDG